MTDKIQKIREELARLKEETSIGLSEHENGVEKGRMEIINALSLFLDTVQKEPVSNVWHDAQIDPPQAKKRILAINEYGFCEVDYAIIIAPYWPKVIKWAYIDDLLKLDNYCQSCENLQEEPVSEDNNLRKASEEYLKVLAETPYNNTPITNAQTIVRELITFLDNPSKYNPNHIEEYVSEDLEEAAKHYLYSNILYDDVYVGNPTDKDCVEMFKAGAQWQKEKMMKEAKESQVILTRITNATLAPSLSSVILDDSFKEGDKVKVILIKEG